ncbi:MAG: WxcM-like domain-containing protein, partial [Bacteroidetes bacterium]|nr:WxcM-like domain-containing protein [Bacteroidota bacterium]
LEIRHDCICSVGCNTSAIFLLLIKETLVKVEVTEPDRIQFVKRRESDSGRFTFEYVPLIIRRIYFLYDLTEGTRRGGHAHRQLSGLILAVRGRFDILLDDGTHQRQLTLTDTGDALFVPRMVWRELSNFSSDAVVLVLASGVYDEQEMIRNYNTFLTAKQNG